MNIHLSAGIIINIHAHCEKVKLTGEIGPGSNMSQNTCFSVVQQGVTFVEHHVADVSNIDLG